MIDYKQVLAPLIDLCGQRMSDPNRTKPVWDHGNSGTIVLDGPRQSGKTTGLIRSTTYRSVVIVKDNDIRDSIMGAATYLMAADQEERKKHVDGSDMPITGSAREEIRFNFDRIFTPGTIAGHWKTLLSTVIKDVDMVFIDDWSLFTSTQKAQLTQFLEALPVSCKAVVKLG